MTVYNSASIEYLGGGSLGRAYLGSSLIKSTPAQIITSGLQYRFESNISATTNLWTSLTSGSLSDTQIISQSLAFNNVVYQPTSRDFQGNLDDVYIAPASQPGSDTDRTWQFWIKVSTYQDGMIWGSLTSTAGAPNTYTSKNYYIMTTSTGFGFQGDVASPYTFLTSSFTGWQNIALTFNKVYNQEPSANIYLNGILVSTETNNGDLDPRNSAGGNTNYISMFSLQDGGANNFAGQFGQMLTYTKILSASEVLENYNATRNQYGK